LTAAAASSPVCVLPVVVTTAVTFLLPAATTIPVTTLLVTSVLFGLGLVWTRFLGPRLAWTSRLPALLIHRIHNKGQEMEAFHQVGTPFPSARRSSKGKVEIES
jgi:hypothetical protein